MCILLVENVQSAATSHVGDEHGVVVCAEDADEAISLLQHELYDLVLIGRTSPPQDGLDLIRQLRVSGNRTPIVILTEPRDEDRAEAVRLGADDALATSVDAVELRTRITSILQRARASTRPVLRLGDLVLCLTTQEAQYRKMLLDLTVKEFSILELLVLRKGSVLTKANFLNQLYAEADQPDGNIIDIFMCKLRKKLERAGAGGLISVVWGHGYMISEMDALRQTVSDIVSAERHDLAF